MPVGPANPPLLGWSPFVVVVLLFLLPVVTRVVVAVGVAVVVSFSWRSRTSVRDLSYFQTGRWFGGRWGGDTTGVLHLEGEGLLQYNPQRFCPKLYGGC